MEIIKKMRSICSGYSEYGKKAGNLIQLYRDGRFSVPESWIIDAAYLTKILCDNGFSYCKNGFDLSERQKIYEFLESDFPKKNYCELWNEIQKIMIESNKIKRYAVRSSHCSEDGDSHSFAGQFSTFLNLSNSTNILHSILKCWRDSFSESVHSYLSLLDVDYIEPCSIILQEMIPSMCAGVICKTNEGVIIHTNWGLCKHIVDGLDGYDEWVYKNSTNKWSSIINDKQTAIIPVYERTNPAFGEKVIGVDLPNRVKLDVVKFSNSDTILEVYLPKELSQISCLDESKVDQVKIAADQAAELLEIECYDMEWCYTPNHELYILQIRPLTRELSSFVSVNTSSYSDNLNILQGMRIVSGCAEGIGYKINSEKDASNFPEGGIVIAKSLIGPALHAAQKANGCIIQAHSVISHSAIIARELGLPTVGAMDIDRLKVEQYYIVDGNQGVIKVSDSLEHEKKNILNQISLRLEDKCLNVYDLRPILTTLMFYSFIPEIILDELEQVAKKYTIFLCEGFEQCDDEDTYRLWKDAVSKLPEMAEYKFLGTDGNFSTYILHRNRS